MKALTDKPFLIGLTGGIGSGKSTVANMLVAGGARLIDADTISRATTAPGGAALSAVVRMFGNHLIDADGALNRDVLRQLVFSDPTARRTLEAIIHPLVAEEITHQQQQAKTDGVALLVHDIPLLVEGGSRWRRQLDRVLVVDCPRDEQIRRVRKRNAMTAAQIQRIIDTQAPREQRLKAADWVVVNGPDTPLQFLQEQVNQLLESLAL